MRKEKIYGRERQKLFRKKPGVISYFDKLMKLHKFDALKEFCVKSKLHPVFLVEVENYEECCLHDTEKSNTINFSELQSKAYFLSWKLKGEDKGIGKDAKRTLSIRRLNNL